jgi:PAS domain S-box-containing protein
MPDMHSLLKRQIRKCFGSQLPVQREWQTFLLTVDEAYREFDSDRAMLERSLELSSQEHIQSTAQMLKVRQMALGIESRMTINDLLSFVVESAREIPGMRFVCVQNLDESKQFLVTPYFSKIRGEGILKLLGAAGFNVEDYLGKYSTSGKLRFEVAKMKIAENYRQNPKTIVADKLSDILDGVWPKPLCDTVQKVIGARRAVITPLQVDGALWGTLLFLLDGHVTQNTLETIAAHCSLGIKNVQILESLQNRNLELATVNRITRQATSSLEVGQVYENTLNEILSAFDADAVSIHFLTEDKQRLELVAQVGMPPLMVDQVKYISVDNAPFGLLFDSDNDFLFGDFTEYSNLFPQYLPLVNGQTPTHFATVIIPYQEQRAGIMTIVRRGKQPFREADKSLLLTIAGQMSLAIENARLHGDVLAKMQEVDATNLKLAKTLEKLTDSEEKIRSTIEAVTEGIITTDMHGSITDVNDAALKMLGFSVKQELIGKNASRLMAEEESFESFQKLMNAVEQTRIKDFECKLMKKDGRTFDAELNAASVRDAVGNFNGFVTSVRDITERKKIETALRESEEKYRNVVELAKDGICIIHSKLVKYCNPRLAEMWGGTVEEIQGTPFSNFLHPQSVKTVVERYNRRMAGEQIPSHYETSLRPKLGGKLDVEVNVATLEYLGQDAEIAIIHDITERKQIETAIRESEEKYRTIFESANDIIILLDINGKILDINSRLTEIGGYERNELIGKNIGELTHIIDEKNLAIVVGNLQKALAGPGIITYQVEMTKKNGEPIDLEVNGIPLKKDSKVAGVLAVLKDVTERNKSELQIREQKALTDRILESTLNAVAVMGQDRRVIIVNKAFEDIFKLASNEAVGKKIEEIIPTSHIIETISQVLAGVKSHFKIEFRIKQNAAERVLVADIISMQKNEVLAMIRDVTEDREIQERLYLTDRLASVGEMAAGIAHELNNPLTGVVALSQLMLESDMPAEMREDLVAISKEGRRAAGIVKNLLSFARSHVMAVQTIEINTIIAEVLSLRAYEHKVNNIQVITYLAPDLPAITADPFQMQQVFLNLVLNAEQAMIESQNRGSLTVSTAKVNDIIRISIADDGPGIPPEIINRIFDPFFTTKDVGKGTGLGLSICYGIVTNQGGRIYAQNQQGTGAIFVVELPINSR